MPHRYPAFSGALGANLSFSVGALPRLVARSARLGLILVVVGGLLLLGSVHRGSLVALAAVTLPLASIALWLSRSHSRRVPAPAWVFVGLCGYTALQCVPLPVGVLAWLAPSNALIWEDATHALGDGARSAPLTVAPSGSREECLKWLLYAAVVVLAARVSRRTGPRWVPGLVGATALGAALITLVHGVLGAKTYFGIYWPEEAVQHWAVGPLLNPNNLAGYLNLGVFCVLGFLYSRRGHVPRGAIGLAAVLLMAVSASCASRAGLVALVLGLVAYPFVLRTAWRGAHARRRVGRLQSVPVVLAAVVSAAVAIALLAGGQHTWQGLLGESLTKLEVFPWLWDMLGDFPWFGSGRGSFDSAFAAYSRANHHLRFQYAENMLAQWLVEWGIPVTVIALLGLLWTCWSILRTSRLSTCGISSMVGIVVLLAQNMLDLALELPGVAVAVAALLGSLWTEGRDLHTPAAPSGAWRGHLSAGIASAILLAGLPLAVSVSVSTERSVEARQRLRRAQQSPDLSPSSVLTQAETFVRAYPADPYFPLVAASAAAAAGTGTDLRWAAQAIRRQPRSGRAHLILASLLAARGRLPQALDMASLAMTHEPALAARVASFMLGVSREAETLARSASRSPSLLVLLARQPEIVSDLRLRIALLEAAVQHDVSSLEPTEALACTLLECMERTDAACSGDLRAPREAQARSAIARLEADARSGNALPMLQARLLSLRGESQQAFAALASGCGRATNQVECLELAVRTAPSGVSDAIVRSVAGAYVEAACAQKNPCPAACARAAEVFSRRGMWEDATEMLERAARSDSSRARWSRVADAANRAGDPARAVRALRRADTAIQR